MNSRPILVATLLLAPQLLSAQNPFARTDAYADAAPSAAARSVRSLAAYLARSGKDDLTRARALYRWVTRHIDYDAAELRAGTHGDLSPDAVLRRKLTICEGYSNLVVALGGAMGLKVATVSGWSKGYDYSTGGSFTGRPNHSWNIVRIEGRWRLMDATWGSGYLDDHQRFVRDFQEHYFLTPPDAFVYDHFPEDAHWQLLDRPLTMDEFADLVYLRPMFFQSGFKITGHGHGRIAADDRLTVTLGVTKPVEVAAELVDPASGRKLGREFAFAQVDAAHAEIDAAFPRAGEYIVRVYAKPRGTPGPFAWVLDYRVDAARGAGDAAFPVPFTGFTASGAWLYESLDGALHPGQTYRFRLRVPGATDVIFDNAGHRTALARSGDEFSAELSAPRGETVIYAQFKEGGRYTGLLKYVGR